MTKEIYRLCSKCKSHICDEDYGYCIDGPYDLHGIPLKMEHYYLSVNERNVGYTSKHYLGRFESAEEAMRYAVENPILMSVANQFCVVCVYKKRKVLGYKKLLAQSFVKEEGKWAPLK